MVRLNENNKKGLCLWCGIEFEDNSRGSEKIFCSKRHRAYYHQRKWLEKEVLKKKKG